MLCIADVALLCDVNNKDHLMRRCLNMKTKIASAFPFENDVGAVLRKVKMPQQQLNMKNCESLKFACMLMLTFTEDEHKNEISTGKQFHMNSNINFLFVNSLKCS